MMLLLSILFRSTVTVTVPAESFDNCYPRQPVGPGAHYYYPRSSLVKIITGISIL